MKGGKRAGAGRKPGSVTKKNQEIAAKAMKEGITPLELVLAAMRLHYAQSQKERSLEKKALHLRAAAHYASLAAPYVHPRLSAIQHAGPNDGPMVWRVEIPSQVRVAIAGNGKVNGNGHHRE